jgi:hypothetical protein
VRTDCSEETKLQVSRSILRTEPGIAHKLACNCMKQKRFLDAIDVCQQVLRIFYDYPCVKDIWQKNREKLENVIYCVLGLKKGTLL